jgi:alpha-tubulin suppressor-like RCC1 family protein
MLSLVAAALVASTFLVACQPAPTLTSITAIAAGSGHACVLHSDRTVECWGADTLGQLGDGSFNSSTGPEFVMGHASPNQGNIITTLVAGGNHSCLIVTTGATLLCWGGFTQYAVVAAQSTPFSPLSGVAAVALGRDHICAAMTSGAAECDGANQLDQLGDGNTTNSAAFLTVPGVSGATAIAAGTNHTCAIVTGGAVMCWGDNSSGQLGNGTTTPSTTPVPVTGLTGATSIAAGGNHTCAIIGGGVIKCWGDNASGQLGNGTTTASTTPVQVSGLIHVHQVVTGLGFTCARLSGGPVDCWGANAAKQLGNGTTTPSSTPVAVTNMTTATQITAGDDFACAVISGNTAKCWGDGQQGQLADHAVGNAGVPIAAQQGIHATGLAQVSVGSATCATTTTSGAVDCWGDNHWGELGNGTYVPSAFPTPVTGVSDATQVASGVQGACALRSTGAVMCWGHNQFGQLGNGTTTDSTTPVAVSGISNASLITGNGSEYCALLTTGDVDCWGADVQDLVPEAFHSTPTALAGFSGVTSVSASANDICAVVTGGTVECVGSDAFGAFGDGGTSPDSTTPVTISPGDVSGAIQVAATYNFVCALLEDHTGKCWGSGGGTLWTPRLINGLTTGTTLTSVTATAGAVCTIDGSAAAACLTSPTTSYFPFSLPGGVSVASVSGDGTDNCIVATDGSGLCQGSSFAGGTGDGALGMATTPQLTRYSAGTAELASGPNGDNCLLHTDGSVTCNGALVAGLGTVTALSSGIKMTCALQSDGTVQCWNFTFGFTKYTTPTPIAVTGATAISAGDMSACAIVTGGTVKCWGSNTVGELGNGTTTSSLTPVQPTGLGPASVISVGSSYACAALVNGTVDCWGNNNLGNLGDGTTTTSLVPVQAVGVTNAISVSALFQSCALLAGGTVDCWGSTVNGGYSATPAAVPGISGANQVTVSTPFSCARTGGSAQCWGDGSYGLGDGTQQTTTVPVAVSSLTTATDIEVAGGPNGAYEGICARLSDTTYSCWGTVTGNGGGSQPWEWVTTSR